MNRPATSTIKLNNVFLFSFETDSTESCQSRLPGAPFSINSRNNITLREKKNTNQLMSRIWIDNESFPLIDVDI